MWFFFILRGPAVDADEEFPKIEKILISPAAYAPVLDKVEDVAE